MISSPASSTAASSSVVVSTSDLRLQRRRLLELIRVNETLRPELRRQRNKLLTANQDQYFLFERLRNYEKCPALQPAQRHLQSDALTPLSSAASADSAEVSRGKRKYRKRRPPAPPAPPKGEPDEQPLTQPPPPPPPPGLAKARQVATASSSSSTAQSLLLPVTQPVCENEETSASPLANTAPAISGTDEEEELMIDEKQSFV